MNLENFKNVFTREKLTRDFLATLACIGSGIALFVAMMLLAKLPGQGTNTFFLLQNLGYFFLVSGVFLGYAAVHRGNIFSGEKSVKPMILETAKKAHILMGVLVASLVSIFIVALVELVPVFLGYIPYAGPVIVALLSVPFFIINFALIIAVVLIWIILPPMVAEGTAMKKMPFDFFELVRRRGLVILAYAALTVVVTGILFMPVLMAIRYSGGITRAVEWNIAPAYPAIFKSIMRPSYITDIITKIAPRTDPLAVLQQYGSEVFNYIEMLGLLLKVLYGVMIAAIISFMSVIFSNLLSIFYSMVKKDILE
jgi:hypothetical protein